MIELPDFSKAFEYENNFYWTSDVFRLAKIVAHYELFKLSNDVPGAIVECGTFKGASLIRFASFRQLFNNSTGKKIISFDAFGEFPQTDFTADMEWRKNFIDESGEQGIGVDQLQLILKNKKLDENIDLIQGDVRLTIREYLKNNPQLKISLLNIDVDVYEATRECIVQLYDYVTVGGVIILDDYANVFPGANKAIDEFFEGKNVSIKRFPFTQSPCYIIKK